MPYYVNPRNNSTFKAYWRKFRGRLFLKLRDIIAWLLCVPPYVDYKFMFYDTPGDGEIIFKMGVPLGTVYETLPDGVSQ